MYVGADLVLSVRVSTEDDDGIIIVRKEQDPLLEMFLHDFGSGIKELAVVSDRALFSIDPIEQVAVVVTNRLR